MIPDIVLTKLHLNHDFCPEIQRMNICMDPNGNIHIHDYDYIDEIVSKNYNQDYELWKKENENGFCWGQEFLVSEKGYLLVIFGHIYYKNMTEEQIKTLDSLKKSHGLLG